MQLDRKVSGLLRRIEEASRRRNFFLAFSQSPVDFINALIASQVRSTLHVSHGSCGLQSAVLQHTCTGHKGHTAPRFIGVASPPKCLSAMQGTLYWMPQVGGNRCNAACGTDPALDEYSVALQYQYESCDSACKCGHLVNTVSPMMGTWETGSTLALCRRGICAPRCQRRSVGRGARARRRRCGARSSSKGVGWRTPSCATSAAASPPAADAPGGATGLQARDSRSE